MPKPGVSDTVIDQTNRVSAVSSYASAIVVASKKGPINTPVLVTGQTNFLQRFTADEKIELGADTAMMEAWIYLNEQPNLYVVRAAKDALYGGAHIRTQNSKAEHASCTEGFEIPEEETDILEDAMLIYGADQGAYNNDLAVAIITDPDEVKLDGCFLVRVYKKGNKVEEHVCSLDPSFKNGYGINCFAEDVLKTSLYVRCDVNNASKNIKVKSYPIEVVGTVTFKNEALETTKRRQKIHTYNYGDVVYVIQDDVTAYYQCTKEGHTLDDAISFVDAENNFLPEVEDDQVIWTLKDLVKPYAPGIEYKEGDIIALQATRSSEKVYYRAKLAGYTGEQAPAFTDETGKYLDRVEEVLEEDSSHTAVVWVNQTQTVEVYRRDAYTFIENDTKVDLQHPVYSDFYMAQAMNLPEFGTAEDPTLVTPIQRTLPAKYHAEYKSEEAQEHYALPKASAIDPVTGKYVLTKLAGGDDGVEFSPSGRIPALNTLKDTKKYSFQLILDGGITDPGYQKEIDAVCKARKDSCHGIIAMPIGCTMGQVTGIAQQDMVDYRRNTLNANTYNLEMYENYQYVYDEFNDKYVYVSPSCFAAARIMSVAQEYGWHWATAGENRGIINSLDCVASHEDGVIDTLCDNQINPMLKEPGRGIMIGDDYTLLSKACDLQDAHISRYVNIYLRPKLRDALRPFLFEFNDAQTRNLIVKMLETFMRPEVSSRAIYDYRIVCDETNNTPRDIQNSICNCWLYIQPTKIIRWIKQSIILQPAGSSLGELEF